MAFLRHLGDQRVFVPAAYAVIGRSQRSAFVFADPRVSGQHAVVTWRDGWSVRDLGSRNGTDVDGRRLAPGEQAPLALGSVLTVGSHHLRMEHDGPPGAVAVRGERVRHARGGLLAVPDDEDPALLVVGSDRGWQLEGESSVVEAVEGQVIEGWSLHLPQGVTLAATAEIDPRVPTIASLALRLRVSLDQEYVEADVVIGGQVHRLAPRTFHDLLVVLARERLADAHATPSEQGWMYFDDLCAALGRDRRHVNVEVFRARQQLVELGVADANALVERRPTTRQVRLGVTDVALEPLT